MPRAEAKKHDGYLARYNTTHVPHIIATGREVQAQKKDGTLVDVFLSVSEVKIYNQVFFSAVLNDITDEKTLREKNKKLIDFNLAIINEIENVSDYKDFIEHILRNFAQLFNFEVGHFYEYNRLRRRLESSDLFFSSKPRKYKAFIEITKKTTFNKGIGLPGTAWEKGNATYYSDIGKERNFPRYRLSKKDLKLKGGLALPITYANKLLGVIEFYSVSALQITKIDIELFEKFSKIIGALYGQYQESRILNLLLDNCGEGIYGLDTEGMTTFVNPRACKILGYQAQELIGHSMHEKIHHSHSDDSPYKRTDCKIYDCINANNPSYVDNEVFWNKLGEAVPIEYAVTPIIENKNILGGVITFLDVTDKRKIKNQMDLIAKLQNRYIQYEDKNLIFDDILRYLLEITGSEYGFIGGILNDFKKKPYLKTYAITNISWDEQSKKFYDENAPKGLEFRNLNSLFGYTIRTGKYLISNDPTHDKRRGGLPKGHPVLNCYLGVPILGLNGEHIAMFGVANRVGGYDKALIDELKPLIHAISNIVESSRHYAVIGDMAKFDPLTGLFNRQYSNLKFDELINKHEKSQTCFCVLMLDLNKFKFINDTYGHQVGDEVLILFSNRVSRLLKGHDFFARVGGDEFIILVENISEPTYTNEIALRISKANNKPYIVQGKSVLCDVSIGIACYPMAGKTKKELLKHVDFALYDAKNKKIPFSLYSNKTKKEFDTVMRLDHDLKNAFIKQDFYFVYQPQVNLKTNKIIGFESLMRWKHPGKGDISPEIFIPILENFGNSEHLNEYVVKHVLDDLQTLQSSFPLKIAINISPRVSDFKRHIKTLVDMIASEQSMLDKNNITLEFEVTESSFINHEANTLKTALQQAKKQGILCSVDDFGVEYSSIQRLTEYQFDAIKIDKVFTQQLDKKNKRSSLAIVKALIQLSEDLDFTLIAEGSETEEQVKILIKLGCIYAQGFYFYKPVSLKKALTLIKNQT